MTRGLILSCCLAGLLIGCGQQQPAPAPPAAPKGINITAPGVNVEVGDKGVKVEAPNVNVNVNPPEKK